MKLKQRSRDMIACLISCRLGGVFDYLAASRPPSFSALRRLAYEIDAPIQGPDKDPSGWKTLAPVKIEGFIFSNRDAHITCTVSQKY